MNAPTTAGRYLDRTRSRIRQICAARGWSLAWQERSGYAHGELAELVEAVRGKHGVIEDEAGDALITLLALIPPDVSLQDCLESMEAKLTQLTYGEEAE